MKKKGLYAAMTLLMAINAVVLVGVAYNRSGEPDATITLTERELSLRQVDKENSGVTFHLNWQRFPQGELEWLDKEKLQAVGFDCRTPVDAADAALRYGKTLPRKAYAVLEYEGPAWQAWQAEEKKKLETTAAGIAVGTATQKELAALQKRLSWAQTSASRLFAVDVGKDPRKLREKYPNRNRYIIAPARVRLQFHQHRREQEGLDEPQKLTGRIEQILTDTIQVPHDKVSSLKAMQGAGEGSPSEYVEWAEKKPHPPRYEVMLNYGKRLEPWCVAIRLFRKT